MDGTGKYIELLWQERETELEKEREREREGYRVRTSKTRQRSFLRHQLEQCDQIGRLLKVLGNKFAYKSSPK